MNRGETSGARDFQLGAILGLVGVALGAFGAHGLEGQLEALAPEIAADRAAWWDTGARYHLFHALAICATAAFVGGRARGAALSFAFGILIFSGTLYGLALGGPRWLGAITPIGGVALMVGWGLAALGARRVAGARDVDAQ